MLRQYTVFMELSHPFHIRWAHGSSELRFWSKIFAVSSFIHLTLGDFDQPGWEWPAALECVGALILLWRPVPIGWFLSFVSTLIPLLFLRDVLTQSVLLMCWSLLGLWGSTTGYSVLKSIRWLGAGTYFVASFHKLNTAFFDPKLSCAHYAAEQIRAHWMPLDLPSIEGVWLSVVVIIVECFLGFLLLRRSLWVWPVGLLFHWPLTVTLAPAFGFVMFASYAAAITPRQLVMLKHTGRRMRWSWMWGLTFISLEYALVPGDWPWTTTPKAVIAGLILALFIGHVSRGARTWASSSDRQGTPLAYATLCVWTLHSLLPYAGIQYQHTAAMLSNLRIDEPCRNSIVVPAQWHGPDPYIRLTKADIGQGQRPRREKILESGLWNVAALATMHRNWYVPHLRPIRFEGVWNQTPFIIDDLCADDWYRALGLDAPGWTGLQLFQKNLERRCDAQCVH